MSLIAIPEPELEYPTGDGKPMAETPVHGLNLSTSIAVLQDWLSGRLDKFVAGNMLVYYVEGDPKVHISPDVFVVLGVPDRERMIYQTWIEPKPSLDLVIEITSPRTRSKDEGRKLALYRDVLGVREYVLFDPLQNALKARQLLYRLENGVYRRVDPVDGRLPSEVLNLHIDRQDRWLRFWNPATGEWLKTAAEKAEFERERAERERRAAQRERREKERIQREANDKIARLEAELEELRRRTKRKESP